MKPVVFQNVSDCSCSGSVVLVCCSDCSVAQALLYGPSCSLREACIHLS